MQTPVEKEIFLTNYLILTGRIGILMFLSVISVGAGILMLSLDVGASRILPTLLFFFPILGLWLPVSVPMSLRIGNDLTVQYLLWSRKYLLSDISNVEIKEVYVSMGPNPFWKLLHSLYFNVDFVLADGTHLRVLYRRDQIHNLQRCFQLCKIDWSTE